MTANRPRIPENVIKLSAVPFYPKHYAGARLKVEAGGYVGELLAAAVDLVGDVSLYHIGHAKPAYMALIPSETNPGDLLGFPTMTESANYLALDWKPQGRTATINLAKLLVHQQIVIPREVNLFIDLYQEVHPEHGPLVGLKLVNPEFRPVKPRKERAAAGTGTQEQTNP